MDFGIKLWAYYLKSCIWSAKWAIIAVSAYSLLTGIIAIFVNMLSAENIVITAFLTVLEVLINLVAPFVLCMIIALAFALMNYKLENALNTYGYSRQYLELFEREKITGKPFSENTALSYAFIFMRMEEHESALNYLQTLNIHKGNTAGWTNYFFMYVMSAIGAGKPELADKLWADNIESINSILAKQFFVTTQKHYFYTAFIYADCAMGRYERALEQALGCLAKKDHHYDKTSRIDMEIIALYALKKLGRDAEMNARMPAVVSMIEHYKPLYNWQATKIRQDFNNAVQGILPL